MRDFPKLRYIPVWICHCSYLCIIDLFVQFITRLSTQSLKAVNNKIAYNSILSSSGATALEFHHPTAGKVKKTLFW